MPDETNIVPLVDILSKQTGRQVVMSGNAYVYMDTKEQVASTDIDTALATQNADSLKFSAKYAKQSIQQSFNAAVEAISSAVPHEMASWRKQEEQARDWNIDNSADTPIIDGLLVSRGFGESKQELVNKIIANADAYVTAYGALLGKFQKLSKQIDEAMTAEQMAVAVW